MTCVCGKRPQAEHACGCVNVATACDLMGPVLFIVYQLQTVLFRGFLVKHTLVLVGSRDTMAAAAAWNESQAYEELLYWDSLIQEGHPLLPHDFDRYTHCM